MSIYEKVKEKFPTATIDHHESDLYIITVDAAQYHEVLDYCRLEGVSANAFTDKVTGAPSIEIPFAYDQYWAHKGRNRKQ